MTSKPLILLVVVVIAVAIIWVFKCRRRIGRVIMDRLNANPEAVRDKAHEPDDVVTASEPGNMTAEESEAELERLQRLIESRKQVAWNSDISHHLWDLYKNLLPYTSPYSSDRHLQDREWYDVKILHVTAQDGLNKLVFELKGARYTFLDDEEKQGWRDLTKQFSLFLFDDQERCLIEIPMKMKVDGDGRHYSILSGGPNAFLLGGWIRDFINVKLMHQRMHNQEIRAQKHQERLSEIEDLKGRFGILD